jgi:MHS family proline/betaine transporter-like MFS transporter
LRLRRRRRLSYSGSATGAALASLMSPEALSDWGWRLPFIFGLFVGLAGYALRRRMTETPAQGHRPR